MMDGMHGIGVAMMITGVATALAVLTLIVLAACSWRAISAPPGRAEASKGEQPGGESAYEVGSINRKVCGYAAGRSAGAAAPPLG